MSWMVCNTFWQSLRPNWIVLAVQTEVGGKRKENMKCQWDTINITHRLLCQDRVSKTINWKNLSFFFFLSSAYPSNMAPIATKLRQNAFRTIPDISFFDQTNFYSKLRTAVYPPRMAPIGLKLRENAFQVIPDISFFDGTNTFCDQNFCCKKFFVNGPKKFSAKCLFWRSCAGLHTNVECSSRIHCQNYRFQPSTTLGGGVKRVKTVFVVSFGLKKLIPSSFLEILFTFVYLLPIRRIRVWSLAVRSSPAGLDRSVDGGPSDREKIDDQTSRNFHSNCCNTAIAWCSG